MLYNKAFGFKDDQNSITTTKSICITIKTKIAKKENETNITNSIIDLSKGIIKIITIGITKSFLIIESIGIIKIGIITIGITKSF